MLGESSAGRVGDTCRLFDRKRLGSARRVSKAGKAPQGRPSASWESEAARDGASGKVRTLGELAGVGASSGEALGNATAGSVASGLRLCSCGPRG
jgi:hypothetical protein